MSPNNDLGITAEERLKQAEEQFQALLTSFNDLKAEVSELRKTVHSLEVQSSGPSSPYVVVCPDCSTKYDMLAHHYSIGLFDNMVYVKCPKCNKSLPVSGGGDGEIGTVSDEKA